MNITYKDLKKSIISVIKKDFKDIPINSNDISEGFQRPSFFIEFDNINRTSSEEHYTKSLLVRIYYFPTTINESSIEILDIQDELEQAFDLKLAVRDRFLNILETDNTISDGVLQFEFNLEFSESKEKNNDEIPLAELNLNMKVDK